jgi:hypothetical protein
VLPPEQLTISSKKSRYRQTNGKEYPLVKQLYPQRFAVIPLALLGLSVVGATGASAVSVAGVSASTTSTSTTTVTNSDSSSSSSTGSSAMTATQQQHLTTIKSKGDAEINRRLTSLNGLATLINAATRLTAADKTTLSGQVSTEQSGLQQLETQLNATTTLAAAITDAESIYSEYRVYALITPKIHIIKAADDQQVTETNLTNLAAKLQTRITADQTAGKNVATLQSDLNDLTIQVKNAQAISGPMEQNVIGLQPSDYNSNHSVLSGDGDQLKAAHNDNETAFADAKKIVSGLESL